MCLPSRHAIDVQGVAGAIVSNRMPHMARRAGKKQWPFRSNQLKPF
jgi:hypothetical protein